MLEPASVAETYRLVQVAFELSERVGTPVFVRLVTAVSNSHAPVAIDEPIPPAEREVILERDIGKYTKAGSAICQLQHRDVIARLERAGCVIEEMGLNELRLAPPPLGGGTEGGGALQEGFESSQSPPPSLPPQGGGREEGGLGVIVSGAAAAYLDEGVQIAARFGLDPEAVSVLRIVATNPFPAAQVRQILRHCGTVLILEELEPHIERGVIIEAHRLGFAGRIVGKLEGGRPTVALDRVGEYGVRQVVLGLAESLGLDIPEGLFQGDGTAEQLAARRPITVCAGCPHRGTYLAINQAIRKLRLKPDEVMVTGDIGCTILGMNPPFHTVWNEVSMGASVSLAQGYVHAGLQTPVIATVGDSTFFHGGIPGLINAVQHQVPLTLIIMDNGWTAMTGMQVNPGTAEPFQAAGGRRVDIATLVEGLGVEHFFVIDPFELDASAATIQQALALPGVKVVLSRQECAIQAQRRGLRTGRMGVIAENCNLCNLCIMRTGCPAIALGDEAIVIDPALCTGCALCAQVCKREAIAREAQS